MNQQAKSITLQQKITTLGPWNYLIEFEPGVFSMPRLHWQGIWHNIVVQDYITRTLSGLLTQICGQDFSELSIIDIGCNEGWFSLVLSRLGFKKVLGIDGNTHNIKKAQLVKDHFQLDNVEFLCADVHEFHTYETFDHAVMLGVVNHLHNPSLALRNINDFIKGSLILDYNVFCEDSHDTSRGYDTSASSPNSVVGKMLVQFENLGGLQSISCGNLVFQFSRRAMMMLLLHAGFTEAFECFPGIMPPNYRNSKRALLCARKAEPHANAQAQFYTNRIYDAAQEDFHATVPRLLEEGFCGYNIISFGLLYFAVPQGRYERFDEVCMVCDEHCAVGFSESELRHIVASFAGQKGIGAVAPLCPLTDRLRAKIHICRDLVVCSDTAKARVILSDLHSALKASLEALGEMQDTALNLLLAEVCFELGRVCEREQLQDEARSWWEACAVYDPNRHDARIRIDMLKASGRNVGAHSVFL